MKILAILAFLFFLGACSFDSNHKSDEQRDALERDSLVQTYSEIQGVYRGTIQTSRRTLQAKLTLTFKEVIVGKDSDGQPRYRPVLVARLSRPELISLDLRMEGAYTSASGDLTLSTQQEGGEFFQIRGRLISRQFRAQMKTASGSLYGDLTTNLESREVQTAEGDDLEQIDRIRAHLKTLTGSYEGIVTPEDVTGPFRAELRLEVEEDLNSDRLPLLVAYYQRAGANTFPARMKVQYSPEKFPAEISCSNAANSGAGVERVSFFGTINQGVIEGALTYPTFRAHFRGSRP